MPSFIITGNSNTPRTLTGSEEGTITVTGSLTADPGVTMSGTLTGASLLVQGTIDNGGGTSVLVTGTGTWSVTVDAGGVLRANGAASGRGIAADASGAGVVTLAGSIISLGDAISFGSQDDTLILQQGYFLVSATNVANGGAGIDLLDFSDLTNPVTVDLTAELGPNSNGNGADRFINFENVIATAQNDTLKGSLGINSIQAGGGNDTILLSGGDDALDGGAGIDMFDLSSAAGGVQVNLTLTTAQNTNAGVLTLLNIEQLTGTSFGDSLTGGVSAATLLGFGGDDWLSGGGVQDSLAGGSGNDTLAGGGGDDTLDGGAGADTLDGGLGLDTLSYASATAAVTVSLAITNAQNTGGAGIDTATNFENLTGGARNDSLTGNAQNNTLTGGGGADTLTGGGGIDLAGYSTALAGLTARLDFAQLNTGDAAGDSYTGISGFEGSRFADFLVGTTGGQALQGGAGNDTIVGRRGADTLTGGAGEDYFAFNPEDFEAGVYDIITDFNAGGVLDWFVTVGVARESILAAVWDNGVVVTIPGVGFGPAGGGVFLQNTTLDAFFGHLASY